MTNDHFLHVGIDHEKTVVAPYRLRMRTGRARRTRWGSLTEVRPATPSGRSGEERFRFACQLGLALVILSAVLTAVAIPWWSAVAGSAALLGYVIWEQARSAAAGVIALPPGDDAHILYAHEERAAFERSFASAKRVQRTWPAMRHLIDVADAERMLSRALWDLSGVLNRRQQIRRLRDELAAVDYRDMPAYSPAVDALLEQRTRVEILWRETGAEANRHIVGINAACTAGENLIREQQIGRTARDAEKAIAHITATAAPGLPANGTELAERTAAVIDAYRDLAARYSDGV